MKGHPCANCHKEVPEGAEVCPVCAHEVGAGVPIVPVAPAASKPGALIAIALASIGLALEAAGVVTGNFVLVGGGYVACSIAFRLGRTALREFDDTFAPGPPQAGRPIAFTGWAMGLAGMVLGVPMGFLAFFAVQY